MEQASLFLQVERWLIYEIKGRVGGGGNGWKCTDAEMTRIIRSIFLLSTPSIHHQYGLNSKYVFFKIIDQMMVNRIDFKIPFFSLQTVFS